MGSRPQQRPGGARHVRPCLLLPLLLVTLLADGRCCAHAVAAQGGSSSSTRRLSQLKVPADNSTLPAAVPAAAAAPPSAAPAAAKPAAAAASSATPAASGAPTVPTVNPLCEWDPQDSSCHPSQAAWDVAVRSSGVWPSSPYRRAVMLAEARDAHCRKQATEAACAKAVQQRCFWVDAGSSGSSSSSSSNSNSSSNSTLPAASGGCASSDLEELLLFASKGQQPDTAVIPAAMACPGSAARAFYSCYAHAQPNITKGCPLLPGCVALPGPLGALQNVCMPKSYFGAQQKVGVVRELLVGLDSLAPSVYSTCAAACWLRQARACANATAEEACTAMPWCVWSPPVLDAKAKQAAIWGDDSGAVDAKAGVSSRVTAAKAVKAPSCKHMTREFAPDNAADKAAKAIYSECEAAPTEAACLKLDRPPLTRGLDWKAWSAVQAAPVEKCQLSV